MTRLGTRLETRLLVACVGNIFLGDDGFGPAVAAELDARGLLAGLPGVRLEDYGIRSVHLVYDLLEGYDVVVLVDTVGRQTGPAGELYVIEPDLGEAGEQPDEARLDPHSLPPGGALALVPVLGGSVRRILVVGVQPESMADGIGLSGPVAAAVSPAAELVADVVRRELASPAQAGEEVRR